MADNCLQYPDIYEVPAGSEAEQEEIKKKNAVSARLYKAVRFVLMQSFDRPELKAAVATDANMKNATPPPVAAIPAEPKDFANPNIPDDVRARFIAILGIIRADNWEDPSNGKDSASSDDSFYRGASKEDSFVVDRRFVDAVVEAVKDYTTSAKLFNNIYKLMREEALQGQQRT